MKVCFIGLGSIGQRHIKNLHLISTQRNTPLRIDALRSSNNPLPADVSGLLDTSYFDPADVPDDYDIAFICNPTHLHHSAIHWMREKARNMFIEKPLFNRVQPVDFIPLQGGIYYIACPLRYTSVYRYLKEHISSDDIFAARVLCSTYLPDWRPGQDYAASYSSKKEMGGGVALDLIHEWDYLCDWFGPPAEVFGTAAHVSALKGNSEDLVLYAARFENRLVSIHLDYFGRYARREIELFTEEDVWVGDFVRQRVSGLKSGKSVGLKEERDTYQCKELSAFLDMVEGKGVNSNPPETALTTLRLALTNTFAE